MWSQGPNHFAPPETGLIHGLASFRRFALIGCVLGLIVICAVLVLRQSIHQQIRSKILEQLNSRLEPAGFAAHLDSAYWVEGQGIRLEGLTIWSRQSSSDSPDLAIDEAFVGTSFRLVDSFNWPPKIEKVSLAHLHLNVNKSAETGWNAERIAKSLARGSNEMALDFPIHLRDASISIDGNSIGLEQPLLLDDINLKIEANRSPQVDTIAGYFSAPLVRQVGFRVNLDLARGTWSAGVKLPNVELSGELNGLVPDHLRDKTSILQSVRGQVDLHGSASGTLDLDRVPDFRVDANFRGIQWYDDQAPYDIRDGSFHLVANNAGLQLRNVVAQVGYGHVQLDVQRTGWLESSSWKVTGMAQQIELTDRLLPWLNLEQQRCWHHYQPRGVLDIAFDIENRQGQVFRDIQYTVTNGSFSHFRFPYRVNDCTGTVRWKNDKVFIDLAAIETQQPIRIFGEITNPGHDWTGVIRGKCEGGLPIDDKLFQAFEAMPDVADVLRQYQITGRFGIDASIERFDGMPDPRIRYDVDLRNAAVRYDHFNYPFFDVSGRLRIDDDTIHFISIRGRNNNGQVECSGQWHPTTGLNLTFFGQTVLLDEELKLALPRYAQEVWSQIRPTGTVDEVTVKLAYHPQAKELGVDLAAEIYANVPNRASTVSIQPVWFPYQMRQVAGHFRMSNGKITIKNFSARHGRTEVNSQGEGDFDEKNWRVRLHDLIARKIDLDQELLTALPGSLSAAVRQLDFDGQLGLQGEFQFSGQNTLSTNYQGPPGQSYVSLGPEADNTLLRWNIELAVGQARLNPGVPFTNGNGLVRLQGSCLGDQVACAGELAIDSIMYQDIQITSLTGPISVDNQHISLGSFANNFGTSRQPVPLSGRVFGGILRTDCQIDIVGDQRFFVQLAVSDADLQQVGFETAMRHLELSGKAFGRLRLGGNLEDIHSIRGEGSLQLRSARIYELPIMLQMLKILRVSEPDRTAFDSGDLEFKVQGEHIDFNRIELNGNAISLIGRGHLNLNSEIDLDFYTVMGRNQLFIPILTQLYRAGSQQILWIEVDGSLGDPKLKRKVLPGLNDSLRKLLGDSTLSRN